MVWLGLASSCHLFLRASEWFANCRKVLENRGCSIFRSRHTTKGAAQGASQQSGGQIPGIEGEDRGKNNADEVGGEKNGDTPEGAKENAAKLLMEFIRREVDAIGGCAAHGVWMGWGREARTREHATEWLGQGLGEVGRKRRKERSGAGLPGKIVLHSGRIRGATRLTADGARAWEITYL